MADALRPEPSGTPGRFDLSSLDLTRLVEIVEHSDITVLRVRSGETEILISRGGSPVELERSRGARPLAGTSDAHGVRPAVVEESRAIVQPVAPATRSADQRAVRATLVGTFYRAPQPGAPPYADVGSVVEAGETIGLIEAMKVFTAVPAPSRGVVEHFLVEDLDVVEYGQEICLLRVEST